MLPTIPTIACLKLLICAQMVPGYPSICTVPSIVTIGPSAGVGVGVGVGVAWLLLLAIADAPALPLDDEDAEDEEDDATSGSLILPLTVKLEVSVPTTACATLTFMFLRSKDCKKPCPTSLFGSFIRSSALLWVVVAVYHTRMRPDCSSTHCSIITLFTSVLSTSSWARAALTCVFLYSPQNFAFSCGFARLSTSM